MSSWRPDFGFNTLVHPTSFASVRRQHLVRYLASFLGALTLAQLWRSEPRTSEFFGNQEGTNETLYMANGRFDSDIVFAILADTSVGAACPANSSTVPERRESWQSGHALDHEVEEPLGRKCATSAMGAAQFCPWCAAVPGGDRPAGSRQAGTPRRSERLVHRLRRGSPVLRAHQHRQRRGCLQL
jgi:hypothetical protein